MSHYYGQSEFHRYSISRQKVPHPNVSFLTVEVNLALNRSKQQIVWQLESPLK